MHGEPVAVRRSGWGQWASVCVWWGGVDVGMATSWARSLHLTSRSWLGKKEGHGRAWHSRILPSPTGLEQHPGCWSYVTQPWGRAGQDPGTRRFSGAPGCAPGPSPQQRRLRVAAPALPGSCALGRGNSVQRWCRSLSNQECEIWACFRR